MSEESLEKARKPLNNSSFYRLLDESSRVDRLSANRRRWRRNSRVGQTFANANARIRYTCDKAFLVSRGHAIAGGWALQMPAVAAQIANSKEFLPGFSWGDQVISDFSNGLPVKNGHGKWIAYDTSHHLAFVVEEVREFERVLVSATSASTA